MKRSTWFETRRTLIGMQPGRKPYHFLFAPDDGTGEATLLVSRDRIDPADRIALLQSGARRFVEGKVRKDDSGKLTFRSADLSDKRFGAMLKLLGDKLAILDGATFSVPD